MVRQSKQHGAGAGAAPESHEAADDQTQPIPLVVGPAVPPVPPTENGGPPDNGAEQQSQEAGVGVPQETVPMPVSSWPTTRMVDAAPDKPPPLRRKESGTGSHRAPPPADAHAPVDAAHRQPWLVQRTGVLTGELRRALPPWALPLLNSQPVSVWLGARIGLTVLAFVAGVLLPGMVPKGTANWYGSPGGPFLNGMVDRLAGVWTRWDGQWYLKVATEGYGKDDGSAAFFPLYPWVLRVVGWLAGERYIWAGMVLSSLFFLAALILLHRLVRLDFHPADAGRTVFYLAIFPAAFFFWAVYSESLFLFLAVWALLAGRTQRWWWAALAISLALWTRMQGLLLLLPVMWELWRAYHPPMPTDPRAMPPARPPRWALLSLGLPLLSFVAFLAWGAIRFGDPIATLRTHDLWNRSFAWPWETVANAVRVAVQMPFQYQPENQSWFYLAALIFALAMGLLSIRWLRGSYSIYLWAGLLLPLLSGTRNNPLLSYPRFVIVLFPAFMALALLGRNRYAHQVILWVSMLLLALYTIRFANWYWVA